MVDISSLIEAAKTAKYLVEVTGDEKEQLKEDSSVQESLVNEGVMIINSGGDLYLKDSEDLDPGEAEKINDMFSNGENDNRIMDQEFKKEVEDFEEEYNETGDELEVLLEHVNSTYQSILNLARVVDRHYDDNNHDLAIQEKQNIANMYGKQGVKLCNLYTSDPSYVKEAAIYFNQSISDKMPRSEKRQMANEVIEELLYAAESIYYIQHHQDSAEALIRNIRIDIENEEAYVAIHSAGQRNRELARQVYEEVQSKAMDNGYNVNAQDPDPNSSVPRLRVRFTKDNIQREFLTK